MLIIHWNKYGYRFRAKSGKQKAENDKDFAIHHLLKNNENKGMVLQILCSSIVLDSQYWRSVIMFDRNKAEIGHPESEMKRPMTELLASRFFINFAAQNFKGND
ncbi:hypothetical protein KXQ82_03975 [Mucilaginibacter sp. HMF5004]|uniref:hypothetical protein n=1 Tax=Mucilaginibacter rivuli TaxID=2857527 RepID=UPI001C5E8254|nr:hypothetical protein [Mucilaginibacter rivuli]MBW4888853.1 hypothetical protein [Mucilaginibacter rivuli]